MAIHCEHGSATKAPKFVFNHCGSVAWGGLEMHEMTERGAWDMRRFVDAEAYRQGWGSRGEQARWNPFHTTYLFGLPFQLWDTLFLRGKSDYLAGQEYSIPEPWEPDDEHEYLLWADVVAQTKALADGFEISYRRLGVAGQSRLRGTVRALCGWLSTYTEDFVPLTDQ